MPEVTLAQTIAEHGDRQLHVAETEKYAHVTYFFNGGVEAAFPGEERRLVPSNRQVATYDLAPEMSAVPVTEDVRSEAVTSRTTRWYVPGHGVVKLVIRRGEDETVMELAALEVMK